MAYEKFEKVIRNVDKLLANPDVTPAELNQYLNAEGFNASRFKKAAENYTKAKGTTSTYGNIEAGIQGLTFGFGDEFEAVIKSLKNKKPYEQNLAAVQFAKEQYEADKPYQAMASEVIGSLPVAFATGGAASSVLSKFPQAASLLEKIPTSLKAIGALTGAGAAGGAVTGAGTAEEGQRMQGAQKGAAMGAVLAPVAFAGLKAGTGATRAVAEKLGIPEVAKKIVEATKDIPVVKEITGKTAEFFGMGADAMQRKADTKIIQALQRDNMSLVDIRSAMDTIRKNGYKPETIMEFGGKNTKRLGETVASYPEARAIAETTAEERKAGSANRILTDFQNAFKVNADPLTITENLIKTRSEAASPLYKAAYAKGASIEGDALDGFMKLPRFKEAYAKAKSLAEYDGITLPELKDKGNLFDLQTADYIKRGLDDVLYVSKTPQSGVGKTEISKLKEKRTEFVKFVDELAPAEYKQARQAFSGATDVIDAIDQGKNFFDVDARTLSSTYNKLTGSEKDGFAIGAYDAIRSKINEGADGIDVVRRTFGSPEKRDQIRVLIGDDAFRTLESQLVREKGIRSTDIQVLGGSQTQPRSVAQQEFEGATELVPQMAQKGLVKGGMDYLLRSVTGTGARTAQAIAPELYSIDPTQQAKMLDRLGLLDQYLKEQALKQQIGTGVISTTPSLLD
jgi:hypothetical protein